MSTMTGGRGECQAGSFFANGNALPPWARNWEFQVHVWEPRTTIWTVMA